jgi:hypothetical protein
MKRGRILHAVSALVALGEMMAHLYKGQSFPSLIQYAASKYPFGKVGLSWYQLHVHVVHINEQGDEHDEEQQ